MNKTIIAIFCRGNDSYVHVGLYLLVELSLLALLGLHLLVGEKVPRSEKSKERKFQGAKVPRSESSTPGTFAPGSEWSWERKVHNSLLFGL